MNDEKYRSCDVKLTVPFHDLDPMQVVWHGNYMKYFDIARFTLFDEAGVLLFGRDEKPDYLFPVVRTFTKHIASLRHNDEFICRAIVIEARIKIILDFQIWLARDGTMCAKGRSEQVAIKLPEMEMLLQIPDDVRNSLESCS